MDAAPHNLHKIPVGEIGAEGKQFAGTLEEDIFSLPEDAPQVAEPLVYDLQVSRHADLLLATGSLQTAFSLECVRCLKRFPYRVELRGHTVEVELDSAEFIDLTEAIREDILLSLPVYPRCEDSSLGALVCDPTVKIYSADDPQTDAEAGARPEAPDRQNVWGALDNLGSLNDND